MASSREFLVANNSAKKYEDNLAYLRRVEDELGASFEEVLNILDEYRRGRINLMDAGSRVWVLPVFDGNQSLMFDFWRLLGLCKNGNIFDQIRYPRETDALSVQKVQDTVIYVCLVRETLGPRYTEFKDILRGFKQNSYHWTTVLARMRMLLRERPDLLSGFYAFAFGARGEAHMI